MKKIILIFIITFSFVNGFAQQFPLQSQYQFNYASINPAAVGEFDHFRLVASYRNQWVGFADEAIATQYLTVTRGFGLNGLGLTLLNDKTGGAFSNSGFKFSYSHKVKYNTHELFLGLSGGGTKMNLASLDDPSIVSNTDFVPQATFGAYIKVNDWKLGVSVPGILNTNMEFTNSSENQIKSNVYTMISYTKKFNDYWSLYPSVLVKNTRNHQQFDANLNVRFKDIVWFGTSYRTSPNKSNQVQEAFGPSFYLGVDLGQFFSIYSHDFSTGNMASYPTHEITMGYDFRPVVQQKVEAIVKPVKDSDNDGVTDSLDLCPNIYGSLTANGCPDLDEDGIPDKYDLCPEMPGSFEAGCPDLTEKEKQIINEVSNNLAFDAGSDRLSRSSYSSLSKLAVLLIQNPTMFLEIHGYASSEGGTSYNLGLSARRAKKVEQFLLSKRVDQNSLIMRFSGEEFPIASNDSEEGRKKNRRVELSVKFHLKDNAYVVSMENAYSEALRVLHGKSSVDDIWIEPIQNNNNVIEDQNLAQVQEDVNNIIENTNDIETASEDIIVDEQEIVESPVNLSNEGRYILVVQVFSSKSNAEKYIDNSAENLAYTKQGGKYYVYVFRANERADAVKFRTSYEGSCWIKSIKE